MQENISKLFQTAIISLKNRKFEDAEGQLKKIIKQEPRHYQSLTLLAMISLNQNNIENAINMLEESLSMNSMQPLAQNLFGLINVKKNKIKHAKKNFLEALRLDPRFVDARNNLVKLLMQNDDKKEAIEVLKNNYLLSNDPAVYYDMGLIYMRDSSKYNEALDCFDRYLKINPKSNIGYIEKIKALNYLQQNNKALNLINQYEKTFQDKSLNYQNIKAIVMKELEKYDQAIKIFKDTLKIKDQESIRKNLASIYLYKKDFKNGWNYYTPNKEQDVIKSIKSKKIVFKSNHGIGDQILYSRVANNLMDFGYEIVVSIDERIHEIVKKKFKNIKILDKYNQKEFIDYEELELSSAPYLLQKEGQGKNKTFNELVFEKKIKKEIPYEVKKIGFSWFSNNPNIGSFKSIKFEDIARIISNKKNIEPYNLQYFDNKEDLNKYKKVIIFKDINYKNDLEELINLIKEMDVVVTISNIVAHLAGLIDKKTFLLLPKGKGNIWYWHDEEFSCWYPSIEIIRQVEPGNWQEVIEKVINKLK